MKKTLFFVFGFLLIMSLGYADNMINNPGFENWTAGSPDDWSTSGGSITLTQNTSEYHGGSSSCEVTFTSTSNQDLKSNIFSVTEGATISVSVWIYDNDPSGRARLSVIYTGASNYYGNYSADQANWQELTYDGTVPAGATEAQFQVRFYDVSPFSGSATLLVDDAVYDHPVSGSLTISNISRQYTVPTSAQTCDVQCDITGGTAPYNAVIKYAVDGVNQADISMSNSGGDTYVGTIPVQSDGARVEYSIQVTDSGADAVETSSTYGLFWGTSPISNATGNIKEVDVDGNLVYEGYYCTVTGIAAVSSGVFSTSNLEVYIQDSFGGINIFKFSDSTTITEGNSYTVTGMIDQYNGKSEIIPDNTSTDIIDNGFFALLNPDIITIAELLSSPEDYEGVLIGIMHVTKDAGTWGPNSNLDISDGTGSLILRIDGDTDLDENAEPVWPKDVVGIFTQYDSSSPFNSGYQIMPRSYADIAEDGSLPVTLSSFTGLCFDGIPHLNWTTQSENENLGWNIYRSEVETGWEDDNVILCNAEMIPGMGTTSTVTNYTYQDIYDLVENTTYYYWLQSISISGNLEIYGQVSVLVEIEEEPNIIPDLPDATVLNTNFPNPFNPNTTIKFDIKEGEAGRLTIFNVRGQKIMEKDFSAGYHTFNWDAGSESSGVYFYTLKTPSYFETKKMILMK